MFILNVYFERLLCIDVAFTHVCRVLPTLFRGAAQGATSATRVEVLRTDTAAIEAQEVGIRRGVRSTRPEAPARSLTAQHARRVIVVASVGKVEGSQLSPDGSV